jgi:hypothetical protein
VGAAKRIQCYINRGDLFPRLLNLESADTTGRLADLELQGSIAKHAAL